MNLSLKSFKDYFPIQTIQKIASRKKLKIYLVGGYLRDYLLHRNCVDLDFTVNKDAVSLAKLFAKRIKGAFVLLDEERGYARVVKKKEEKTHTYDFANFRAKTLEGDLSRRDFTINTVCLDLKDLFGSTSLNKILIDLKNGCKDIKGKKIIMVSVKSFQEDPLRLLRAFSLQGMLKFKIEEKTLRQIKKDKDQIRDVAYERIRDELFKILECEDAAKILKAMDKIGLLEKVIPHINVMYNVKQGAYHHLDVWPHSLETVVQLERIFSGIKDKDISFYIHESMGGERNRMALMKLAALLHDIGKPQTRRIENGKMSFHGHEKIGKDIVKKIAALLKLSTRERHSLEDMVFWHLRPGYLSNFKSPTPRAVFRYFRDTKDEALSILLLSLADQRSTRGPLTSEYDQRHHERIAKNLIKLYLEQKNKKPFVRLIDGHDLIRKLKLKPSPLFAKILNDVEEKQSLGKVKTKKEAMDLAKRIAAKQKSIKK